MRRKKNKRWFRNFDFKPKLALNLSLESFTMPEKRLDGNVFNKRKKRRRMASCRTICYGKCISSATSCTSQ
ncbi:hypothetical protein L5515_001430 [Caenorhabditis briggsae]|uniref:Uncharacterized protein n=1 Tax=Caenorhabditis briggsae TaxID=6238 RepID=A0AAE9J3E0_CAEBR|nr:hypothetical protein L5515_001430 [Caenorhabditis briggsae]